MSVRSWHLWSTSPLAPCCSCLAAGCCRSLHCHFTGGASCAHERLREAVATHAIACQTPHPTPGPLFFCAPPDSPYVHAGCSMARHERTRPTVLSDVRYPDAHPHVQIPFSAYAPPPPVNHVDRAWLVARGLSVASCSSHVTEPHPCCPMQKNHVAKVIVSRFREIIWNHARKAWPHAATRFVM